MIFAKKHAREGNPETTAEAGFKNMIHKTSIYSMLINCINRHEALQ